MTKAMLERTYGIQIKDDSFYSHLSGRFVKCYKYYDAEGCEWNNGLRTIKDVENDCRKWRDSLLRIKDGEIERHGHYVGEVVTYRGHKCRVTATWIDEGRKGVSIIPTGGYGFEIDVYNDQL